jgi:rare lipoprotein A
LAFGLIFFPQSLCFLILLSFVLERALEVLITISTGQFKCYPLRSNLQALIVGTSLLVACAPGTQSQSSLAQGLTTPEGMASWYGAEFAGRPTSNGEIYDPSQLTAAHRTLPFGTFVRVTNMKNGLNIVVRINDRGPFAKGRIIDVSRAAAEVLAMIGPGTAQVRLELVSNEPAPTAASPETNTTVAADAALATYNVISADYQLGQILMLSSPTQPNPVIVRVASNTMPVSSGVTMFVSNALFGMFGEHVTVVLGN